MGVFIVVVALVCAQSEAREAPAQVTPAAQRRISIEDAMARAAQESEEVDVARVEVARADAAQTRAWSGWLPQVNGTLGYDRTLASEYEGIFDTASAAPPAFSELPFGRENTYRVGVTVSESVFDGGQTLAAIRAANAAQKTSNLGLVSARAQALIDVVATYYEALLADRLLDIALRTLEQAELTYNFAQLGVQNGARPEVDALRARVAMQNQRPVVLQRRNARDAAMLRLKRAIGVPLEEDVVLTSTLTGEPDEVVAAAVAVAEPNLRDRAALLQAQELVDLRGDAVLAAYGQYLPRLSLNMSYGWVQYPNDPWPGLDGWRNNWIIGGLISLPLFTGLRNYADVRTAHADLTEAEARLRAAREIDDVERRVIEQQIEYARAAFAATAGVVEDAERARSIAELRYREGLTTQLELDDAQLQLDQAQVNRAVAARDLRLALLRRALLPLLPLGAEG